MLVYLAADVEGVDEDGTELMLTRRVKRAGAAATMPGGLPPRQDKKGAGRKSGAELRLKHRQHRSNAQGHAAPLA